jgi:hypothetical protein
MKSKVKVEFSFLKIIFNFLGLFSLLTNFSFVDCLNFDSLMNSYKTYEYYTHSYKDVANTTWKEIVVADRLVNLVKCQPAYVDSDKEIDLLVLDSETKLYWVSNIRGTSGNFLHQFISKSKLLDFVVNGDANYRSEFFILGIKSSGKKILKFSSFEHHDNKSIYWAEEDFFDLESPEVSFIIKDNIITGFNLFPVASDTQVS